ncbi:Na+/H+ antiporter NhaA [Perlucidibaca aquatica]|uniref:Na+/H+ antiporter NhaA n=1 Tax=Perlucidibaca aquatica TaxID=1852776 RepID=UPI00083A9741|nr:Na+/H+ antiporter NhaA [Perlucidibaca aquatica]
MTRWNQLTGEVQSGLLLLTATALALILANSAGVGLYQELLSIPVQVRVGALDIDKSLLLWINDGLMAMFFLMVGLEIKREVVHGHLSSLRKLALPGFAAIGGMLVPALIYASLNWHDPVLLQGWAIPSATDIAFALGVLAMLGSRVPPALKAFVLALAVMDDLGAVIIIALFYTSQLSVLSLSVAAAATSVLVLLNVLGVRRIAIYMVVGVVLWISVLKSGVHATLAGVVIALAMPVRHDADGHSPAESLEHALHPWVAFFIVPVFAFANAGVSLQGVGAEVFSNSVFQGIFLGLVLGKQLGIFAFSWLCIRLGWATLPENTSYRQLYGAAVLCGIGFTMSLFISSLAFQHSGSSVELVDRLAVLMASILSACWGYAVLSRRS